MADELKILRPCSVKPLGPGERYVYTDDELRALEEDMRVRRENFKPLLTSDYGFLDPELREELQKLLADIKLQEQSREREELMGELMQTCRREEPSEDELNAQIDDQIRFAELMSRSEVQGDDNGNT